MKMAQFLTAVLAVFAFIASGNAYAASAEDCAYLLRIHPGLTCNEDTPQSLIDSVKEIGFTPDLADAKDYLYSIAKGLPGTKADPKCNGRSKLNIQRLNNTFAICAANFSKAYESVYGEGSIVLRSAYRPPANLGDGCGSNAAAGGARNSQHKQGRAIDINPNGQSYKTLWNFARKNPNFGVCFPYLSKDRPHLALAGVNTGEASKCARQGVTRACSGAPAFNPNEKEYDQTWEPPKDYYGKDEDNFDKGNTGSGDSMSDTTDYSGNSSSVNTGNEANIVGSPYDGQTPNAGGPNDSYGGDNMGPRSVNLDVSGNDESFDSDTKKDGLINTNDWLTKSNENPSTESKYNDGYINDKKESITPSNSGGASKSQNTNTKRIDKVAKRNALQKFFVDPIKNATKGIYKAAFLGSGQQQQKAIQEINSQPSPSAQAVQVETNSSNTSSIKNSDTEYSTSAGGTASKNNSSKPYKPWWQLYDVRENDKAKETSGRLYGFFYTDVPEWKDVTFFDIIRRMFTF